jgi:hypothetical protein
MKEFNLVIKKCINGKKDNINVFISRIYNLIE